MVERQLPKLNVAGSSPVSRSKSSRSGRKVGAAAFYRAETDENPPAQAGRKSRPFRCAGKSAGTRGTRAKIALPSSPVSRSKSSRSGRKVGAAAFYRAETDENPPAQAGRKSRPFRCAGKSAGTRGTRAKIALPSSPVSRSKSSRSGRKVGAAAFYRAEAGENPPAQTDCF